MIDEKEAGIILGIMSRADGGCINCAEELFEKFVNRFPQFKEVAKMKFKAIFKEELDLEEMK